jgi:hypothetical protein
MWVRVRKKHGAIVIDSEIKPSLDSATPDSRPNLPQTTLDRFADGHSDRPAELHGGDVFAYDFPVYRRKSQQPLSDRSIAVGGLIKAGGKLLHQ